MRPGSIGRQLDLGDDGLSHRRDTAQSARRSGCQALDLEAQRIARQDGPAEARPLDRDEAERHLIVAQVAGELGERLADQDAGQHGHTREVPDEARLVDAHQLGADRAGARLDLEHPIDEREREPARRAAAGSESAHP